MVKVRIEYKGQVREFEKDAVIAFFPDKESARMIFTGETSLKRVTGTLSAGIPRILELASESRTEYIDAMVEVYKRFEEKIKEELKAGGINPLVDALVKIKKL
ncbi:hypothetical protein [Lachnoclostridium sp. Marseille-P6806]|uniref:hypothetical protein n=1 Tax=Lachnoclostridium sp. Marseille-P6806 TaxID=2364793 RepID=UPI0035683E9B